jgi:hypothetical protein
MVTHANFTSVDHDHGALRKYRASKSADAFSTSLSTVPVSKNMGLALVLITNVTVIAWHKKFDHGKGSFTIYRDHTVRLM